MKFLIYLYIYIIQDFWAVIVLLLRKSYSDNASLTSDYNLTYLRTVLVYLYSSNIRCAFIRYSFSLYSLLYVDSIIIVFY